LLDGGPPRDVRLAGTHTPSGHRGVARLPRDGKSDAAIEAALAATLGRIAVITGNAPSALLEARLLAATAVALAAPAQRPAPWPRDASLVVVTDGNSPPWATALEPVAV
jgi:hypothetical protein